MLYNKNWETKVTKVNPVAKLLRDAADLIEKHGHAKRELRSHNGSLCFMGALYEASGSWLHWNEKLHKPAVEAVENYLQIIPQSWSCESIVKWNNAPERTGQEVIDAMRAAADAADAS